MKEKIIVTHQNGCYPIYIGHNIVAQKELLLNHIVGQQIMIVTNSTVAELYLKDLLLTLPTADVVILSDGENFKTIESWQNILNQLAEKHHHRDTTIIALGGGVIGDLTGFAAACYHRGVNLIQIPTTLLAQVDSSIGSKTAINHAMGKNLIGAFYAPTAVFIDTHFLRTLPEREYRAGLAEIIKASLIRDSAFFSWLENHIDDLLKHDTDALSYAILQSCKIKSEIVILDEKEKNIRALLNFGHTFGHAAEVALGYGTWLHGEAVAWGMICAAKLSFHLGWLDEASYKRIIHILNQTQLNLSLPNEIKPETIYSYMLSDKKIKNNALYLILLKNIGTATVTDISPAKLKEFLNLHLSNNPIYVRSVE